MRAPGPVDGLMFLPNAGREAQLPAGVSVSVRVLGPAGPGLWRVQAAGREFTARSSLALTPGALLMARVERPSGGGLLLRLPAGPSGAADRASRLLASLGLPPDAAARFALHALLAEGQRPEAASLGRVRRAALRAPRGEEAERAGLAARIEAKGLAATDALVEDLAGLAEGGGGDGGGEAQGRDGEGRQARDPIPREGAPPGPAVPELPAPESGALESEPAGEGIPSSAESSPKSSSESSPELLSALAELVRSLVERQAEGGGRDELLALFNQARAPGAQWLYLPFRVAIDSVALAGGFRILLPDLRGGRGRFEARFEVEGARGEGGWAFAFSFGPGAPRLLELLPGRPPPPAALASLEASLAGIGFGLRLLDPRAGDGAVGDGRGAEGLDVFA